MKPRLIFISMLLLTGLFACDSENEIEPHNLQGFFPLADNLEWTYQKTLIMPEGRDNWELGDVTWKVDGDTTIDGKSYRRIIDVATGIVAKVVRKEGGKYIGRNHELYSGFTHEYVFLDERVAVGSSWSYLKFDGAMKTEYIVKALHLEHTIQGVTYKNVLELEVNYYYEATEDEFVLHYSAKHLYAKDIGEIYSFYPHPGSGFFVGDLCTDLMNFKN